MFLESSNHYPEKRGSIEVICGSMFSGKTEELLSRVNKVRFANLKAKIFKPKIDSRYDAKKVVSHDGNSIESIVVENSNKILKYCNEAHVIAIDEAQFFDNDLLVICNKLAAKGIRVIVAGLDMDYLGKPFGPIPNLLAIAEHITKVHAVCIDCGAPANHSFRICKDSELVKLGEKKEYKPLCRHCFNNEK
jgi:thymidine kinase|tara:strand:- start:5505 stop:6077 length:573 start_codon:yes stop_codon:yes gene_type:complete